MAMMQAAMDTRCMRTIMATQADYAEILEDVIKIAILRKDMDVLKAILPRQESLPIADSIFWLAAESEELSDEDIMWLLEQPSEQFVKAFWQRTWRDPNFPARRRTCLLVAYLLKTKDKATEDMLEECSYGPVGSGENYMFETLVWNLCDNDEISDPPVTERAAEIVAERCIRETIERFFDRTHIPITERIVGAAEKNPQDGMEEMLAVLKGKAS
jgi:hypothetical protein